MTTIFQQIKLFEEHNIIKVSGRVHRILVQGKYRMFFVLHDGYDYIQCVFTGQQIPTLESTIVVYGTVKKNQYAPGGHEIQCENWELVPEAIDNKIIQDDNIITL